MDGEKFIDRLDSQMKTMTIEIDMQPSNIIKISKMIKDDLPFSSARRRSFRAF
jgi:hypothetical protein